MRPDLAVQLNERLKASGKVLSSTLHNGEPGGRGYTMADTYTTEKIKIPSTINTYMGDESFVEVFGMKIIEGRNFFPHSASDSSSVILNETAVKELQITENPIGSILNGDLVVVGVVADFHTASFREAIVPLVIRIPNEKITTTPYWSLSVRPYQYNEDLLPLMRTLWGGVAPAEPFEYHFLSGNFERILEREQLLQKLILVASIVVVLISCIGMFALSSLSVSQQKKEIAIRKILGAPMGSVIFLVARQFFAIVLFAILIGIPIASIVLSSWLDNFAYKIQISSFEFILAALILIHLCVSTIGHHLLKSVTRNVISELT